MHLGRSKWSAASARSGVEGDVLRCVNSEGRWELNHQDCAVLANINKQMPDITGGIHIVSMSFRFSTLTQVTTES